jgi:hypothetical protein
MLHRKAIMGSAVNAVAQTPLILNPHLPKTPSSSRNPRMVSRFDSILSMNGSPLVNPYVRNGEEKQESIARKAARASSILAVPLTSTSGSNSNIPGQFVLELDPMRSPSAETLKNLDSPAKKQVVEHLERLQQQLQSLVDSVKK